MKYIDAEKLKAEIEKKRKTLISEYNELAKYEVWRSANDNKIKIYTISDILSLINSLQQEQQKSNLENEIKNYTETLYHEIFGNGQGTLDEFDWEDIAQVIDETARYFYNLNKN